MEGVRLGVSGLGLRACQRRHGPGYRDCMCRACLRLTLYTSLMSGLGSKLWALDNGEGVKGLGGRVCAARVQANSA